MPLFDNIKRFMGMGPKEPTEVLLTIARPMPANLSEAQRIEQARYRLDAIKRYCEQRDAEGRPIVPAKIVEFRNEFRRLTAFLLERGQLTEEEFVAFEAIIIKFRG